METKTIKTWTATIFIAGQLSQIEAELRKWVMRGACVTLEPCRYIFKGGSEDGARIGIIQYPRFPKEELDLRDQAVCLARDLIVSLSQLSASIVMPDETIWIYSEDKPKSALA